MGQTEQGEPAVVGLYSYPLKGFDGHAFQRVSVGAGETMPDDRRFAIENGPGRFKPDAPGHVPKINFLMRMRNERIACLATHYDFDRSHLTIMRDGKSVASGDLSTPLGRQMIEQFIAAYFEADLRGRPKIVSADGHSFSDVPAKCLHIVNMASVRALEEQAGRAIDVARFRANVVIDTGTPWEEFTWLDRDVAIGPVRLAVWGRTDRCAAVNVNPETAERDMGLTALLERHFNHIDFGVYAKVIEGGEIAVGNTVAVM